MVEESKDVKAIEPKKEQTLDEKKNAWKEAAAKFGKGELSESQLVAQLVELSAKQEIANRIVDFGYEIIEQKPARVKPTYLSKKDYDEYRRSQIGMNRQYNEIAKAKKALQGEAWKMAEKYGYSELSEPQITVHGHIVPTDVVQKSIRDKSDFDEIEADWPKISDDERKHVRKFMDDLRSENDKLENIQITINDWLFKTAETYDYNGEWPVKITEERQMMYDSKRDK